MICYQNNFYHLALILILIKKKKKTEKAVCTVKVFCRQKLTHH